MSNNKNLLQTIIVTWNNSGTIMKCLQSIKECAPAYLSSVLLIDNHSTDGSIPDVETSYPEILVIKNSVNLGFAKAVNQGLMNSSSRYCLILNPDTIVNPDTLQGLTEFMEKTPEVGLAGPQVISPDNIQELSFGCFPNVWNEYIQRKRYYQLERKEPTIIDWMYHQIKESKEVDWVSGVCMIIRREAVEKAGYLDENYFMYYEDIDYCHTLKDAGWKIYYYPQAIIQHARGTSMKQNQDEVMKEYRKSQKYYYQKYCGTLSQIMLSLRNRFRN
jgi:GT2 family glycosyltransferase